MNESLTFRTNVHFQLRSKGQKAITSAETPSVPAAQGRIPRITKLLALAHRFEKLISDGDVRDYAELARLGHVTRARLTQIMNLLGLAPDIQEAILSLPSVDAGDKSVHERWLRQLVATLDWNKQRKLWRSFVQPSNSGRSSKPENSGGTLPKLASNV